MFSQIDFGTENCLCLLIHSLNCVWWEGCRCLRNCQQEHLDISDQNLIVILTNCFNNCNCFMKQKAAASFYLVRFPDPLATGSRGTSLPFTESGSSRSQLLAFTQHTCHSSCWSSWYDQHTSTWHQPSSSLELLDFYCDHQLFIMIKSLQCINVNHQCSSSMVRPGQLCISAVSHLTIIHPHSTH